MDFYDSLAVVLSSVVVITIFIYCGEKFLIWFDNSRLKIQIENIIGPAIVFIILAVIGYFFFTYGGLEEPIYRKL
jgi:hypothetical protein